MAVLEILEYPDPCLRLNAQPVTVFDENLGQLIEDLIDTMHAAKAIGLSATQVNDQRNVLVMDLSEDGSSPEVYVNPKIHAKAAWGLIEESCLSVPGITGNVIRATQVRMEAQDHNGRPFERDLRGMHAVCLQHEMDHLSGKLFIDRLSVFRRWWIHASVRRKAAQLARAA